MKTTTLAALALLIAAGSRGPALAGDTWTVHPGRDFLEQFLDPEDPDAEAALTLRGYEVMGRTKWFYDVDRKTAFRLASTGIKAMDPVARSLAEYRGVVRGGDRTGDGELWFTVRAVTDLAAGPAVRTLRGRLRLTTSPGDGGPEMGALAVIGGERFLAVGPLAQGLDAHPEATWEIEVAAPEVPPGIEAFAGPRGRGAAPPVYRVRSVTFVPNPTP